MAKDPAFLFYSKDFLEGTMTMTDEQTGKYVKLLCLQHQRGGLTKKEIEFVCRGEDPVIFEKFPKSEDGLYRNSRLKTESEKRSAYSESRRNNRKSHMNNICKSHDEHMVNGNANGNVNINVNKGDKRIVKGKRGKKFRRPSLDQVRAYCRERNSCVDPEYFWNNYESTDWIKANGQKVVNWKSTIITWEKKENERNKQHIGNSKGNNRTDRQKELDAIGEEVRNDL